MCVQPVGSSNQDESKADESPALQSRQADTVHGTSGSRQRPRKNPSLSAKGLQRIFRESILDQLREQKADGEHTLERKRTDRHTLCPAALCCACLRAERV
jgi:hypothetical protein